MKQYSIKELKDEYKRLGYDWERFSIVGIRSKKDEYDRYDDLIGIIEYDNIFWFKGTTNPGAHWLHNFINPKGTAVLVPNQYKDTYQLDLHQGKYLALCQRSPVSVYRDTNKNKVSDETGVIEKGLFGINIHRSNSNIASILIGKYSAGCQVLSNPKDFDNLIKKCKSSSRKTFTYTLLREF